MAETTEYTILVVDDEPDIHLVTKMALKTMRFNGKKIKLLSAASAAEARKILQEYPDVGVILLDVVMESPTAGLDLVETIRGELRKNHVRIILRTGQPGSAPEKDVIEQYDIDGYLAKAEITGIKLYSTVRTALKAYLELISLARHEEVLSFLHDSVTALHSYQPLEVILNKVLRIAVGVFPTDLAFLNLESLQSDGTPQNHLFHIAAGPGASATHAGGVPQAVDATVAALRKADLSGGSVLEREGGIVIPLHLHHELGTGYIFLRGNQLDDLSRNVLPVLASHAENALYSSLAQTNLESRKGEFFDSISI